MSETLAELPKTDGRLVDNVVHFTQALRKAGVAVGTGQVETAVRAVSTVGFSNRLDFYHILRATLIRRVTDLEIFHQVFSMFWRDPEFLESLMHSLSPQLESSDTPPPAAAARRRAEDALGDRKESQPEKPKTEVVDFAAFTWSSKQVLKTKDFEQMSAAELAEASVAIRSLKLPVKPFLTRRTRPDARGSLIDARATLRKAARRGGDIQDLAQRTKRVRPPDLVALCDISGSMAVYSRIILRYLHAMAHTRVPIWGRVHAFTFGTELTNISTALKKPDPDIALGAIGQEARDWEGGTKIGDALARFNRDWTRRVLGRGAVVLLITDGLERGDLDLLEQEAARLQRTARQLIWLNPLLRYDGFAPLASGVSRLLGNVDSFHACHSLDSLEALSSALGSPDLRDHYLRLRR
ncbi:MAG: VWA domain-containing protein [Pseudomonadota bacterium]